MKSLCLRRQIRLSFLSVWIVFLFFFIPAVSLAVITGSAHDFSASGWSSGEICIACHTPHGADQAVGDAPLWNHTVTTATYTLYNSSTLNAIPEQPGQVSKLCLSCHDGTIALDSFGGASGSNMITGAANLGIDLSDDHPVSITWDHSTILGGGSSMCSNCHNLHNPTWKPPLPFYNSKLECATCHDPHNNATSIKMLRLPITGSQLCLYCHNI